MEPACTMCRHRLPVRDVSERPSCRAFPEGIPAEIWDCKRGHVDRYPGDGGITFEPGPPDWAWQLPVDTGSQGDKR